MGYAKTREEWREVFPNAEKLAPLLRRATFARVGQALMLGYCAVAALSIALTQILVLSFLAYWMVFRCCSTERGRWPVESRYFHLYLAPMLLWASINFTSAIVGIDPLAALSEFVKSGVYLLLPFALLDLFRASDASRFEYNLERYLFAFIFGQSLASLHTIASAALETQLKPHIPGAVTESGQLVLVLPLLIALAVCCRYDATEGMRFRFTLGADLLGMVVAVTGVILAWPSILPITISAGVLRALLATGLIAIAGYVLLSDGKRSLRWPPTRQLLAFCGGLLCAALFINLKRAPWLGVCVELLLIGLLLSRRAIIFGVLAVVIGLFALLPTRERLEQSMNDFSISGGRQQMWALGVELVERYPLGLGPDNADFMQQLDARLPDSHRHMHNNFLNVAVENGWLGLLTFLWWMGAVIFSAFSTWRRAKERDVFTAQASLAIGVALVGWQVAGVAEYNFGDGEVRIIAMFLMGLVLALAVRAEDLKRYASA